MAEHKIAVFLKQLRKTFGYSANEVVCRLKEYNINISAKTLYGYESGLSMLNADVFVALCDIYKCDNPMDLFSTPSLKATDYKLVEKYQSLDDHGRELINMVLDKELQRVKNSQTKERTASQGCRIINYYQRLASAGTGQFVFDNIPVDMIEIPDIPRYKKVKYAIGVNGHSMEPEYYEGDKLLVEPTDTIEYGEIGIFISEGDAFVKKLGTNELISINEDYDNIPFTPNTRCVGRVIDILNDLDVFSKENLDAIRNGMNVNAESSLVQNW